MTIMAKIVEGLNWVANFFYSQYLNCYTSVWPLTLLADNLYGISTWFYSVAWDFSAFFSWLLTRCEEVSQTLTWGNIYWYFKSYFDAALNAWSWVSNAWSNVWNIIDQWWSGAITEVQGLIAAATQGFDSLVAAWSNFWTYTWPQWTTKLSLLAADWGNFVTHKLPTLFDLSYAEVWWRSKLTDISGIITTSLKEYEPFWAGWQDWRDKVIEFFTDPEEWLYKALDRIIERFW